MKPVYIASSGIFSVRKGKGSTCVDASANRSFSRFSVEECSAIYAANTGLTAIFSTPSAAFQAVRRIAELFYDNHQATRQALKSQ